MKRFTAPDGSLVALVDCDSFYASCEKVARPDLDQKPVVVLSNNDGCIVARSREAKKLGIPMGEPAYKLKAMLDRHQVAVFSSNYTLYGDLSHRVMQTIGSVVPDMEIYSIDEAFAPLKGALALNATEIAAQIKERVMKWVGLPVSIGLAPTKALAKIATSVAKKRPEQGGIFDLSLSPELERILAAVHIKDVWGVGRRGALKLRDVGITNALLLRDAEPALVRKLLTITGLNLQMELKGIPAIREDVPLTHTTIISSRSLGKKTCQLDVLGQAVSFHAARAAEKLRRKNLTARNVSVRIQTAYYAIDQPQHDEMTTVRLARPVFDSGAIITAAKRGLEKIFRHGFDYAKVMVMLTDLSDCDGDQHDLETRDKAEDEKRKILMGLMDRINRTQGRGTLTFAAQGRNNADWHMKRDNLSPAWTTDIAQLLRVGGVSQKK